MATESTTAKAVYLAIEGDAEKRVFQIAREFTSLGRTSKNDIRLPFGSVSRVHATILRTPIGYKIVDAGSHNGVFVNGQEVIEKYLQEGDLIQLGEVKLVFTGAIPDGGRITDRFPIPQGEIPKAAERPAESQAPREAGDATPEPPKVVVIPPVVPEREPRTRRWKLVTVRAPTPVLELVLLVSSVILVAVGAALFYLNPPVHVVDPSVGNRLTSEVNEFKRSQRNLQEFFFSEQRNELGRLEQQLKEISEKLSQLGNALREERVPHAAKPTLPEKEPASPVDPVPAPDSRKRTPQGRIDDESD